MRLRLVLGVLGAILRPASALYVLPCALDLADGEMRGAGSFAIGGVVCLAVGFLLGRLPKPVPVFQRREALAVVSLSWLLLSVVGAVPIVLQGYSVVDGVFEAMSGYTTTGASIVADYSSGGRGFYLWRALTNWVGGAGVISLFVLVLPGLGIGGRQLFFAQSAAAPGEMLSPQVRRTARQLLSVYVGLTAIETVLLVLSGLAPYDATVHSMATLATGGFSPHPASVGGYQNPAAEWTVTAFMFLGGTSFVMLVRAARGRPGDLFRDGEFRLYAGIVLAITALVAVLLAGGVPDATDLRLAAFNVVSMATTTGFATADFDRWGDAARVLLVVAMVLGACAASTAGGVKLVRYMVVGRFLRRELMQALHPSAVIPVRYKGAVVASPVLRAVVAVTALFAVTWVAEGALLVLLGSTLEEGFSASIACLNNVGPGLGRMGPMGSYAHLPDASKLSLIVAMWLGRLEIITVLVLFHRDAWTGTRWRAAPPAGGPAPPRP